MVYTQMTEVLNMNIKVIVGSISEQSNNMKLAKN